MIHELKTWPEYFRAVRLGMKTFELRRNDRAFMFGDTLILQEYNPETRAYTGETLTVKVTCVYFDNELPGGLQPGYCLMGIERLS